MSDRKSLVSTSVVGQVARGAVGFGLLAGSLALAPVVGLLSLALVPVGVLTLRGCPACWVIALAQAISRGRVERSCVDGRCQLNSVTRSSSL